MIPKERVARHEVTACTPSPDSCVFTRDDIAWNLDRGGRLTRSHHLLS